MAILRDGPFLKSAGLGRDNLGLLFLLLPNVILGLINREPDALAALVSLFLTLGAALAVTVGSKNSQRRLAGLDWAVSGLMAWLLIRLQADSAWIRTGGYLVCGALAGLLVSQPAAARLLKAPALIPFLTIGLTWLIFGLGRAALARPEQLSINWGAATWPEIAALAAAGICLAAGKNRGLHLAWPWLVAGAVFWALPPGQGGLWGFETNPPGPAEISPLMAATFFVVPQLAPGRLELAAGEIILGLFLLAAVCPFHNQSQAPLVTDQGRPSPAALEPPPGGILADPRPLLAVLAALVPLALGRAIRRPGRPQSGPNLFEPSPAKARLTCGHRGQAARLAAWRGLASCALANQHDGGPLSCPYGCLGLGDCARACPFGAIELNNGFPRYEPELCRGCGLCAKVCPKKLWKMEKPPGRVFIACSARSSLKTNADYCPGACLGCGRCKKACPAMAISRRESRGAMSVDQELCLAYGQACGQICARVCPRGLLTTRKKS